MAAFADVEDLATHLQRDLDEFESATAEQILTLISAEIRAYTGRTLSAVTDETVVLDGTYSALLRLPDYPVTTLTSITADGVLVPATDYRLYADAGIVRRTSGWGWGWKYGGVTVVYSHGYAADSPEMMTLKGICLDLARDAFTSSGGTIKTESTEQDSITYADVALGLPAVEDRLSRFKAMVMA